MKRTLIALACTLAFAGGNALAQDRSTSKAESTAESAGHKAKDAAHRAGDKTRRMGHRMEHKMDKARAHHEARRAQEAGDDTRAMGGSGSSMAGESAPQKRLDQASTSPTCGRSADTQSR